MQVRSLVRELRTHMLLGNEAHVSQLNLRALEPVLPNREAHVLQQRPRANNRTKEAQLRTESRMVVARDCRWGNGERLAKGCKLPVMSQSRDLMCSVMITVNNTVQCCVTHLKFLRELSVLTTKMKW